MSKPFAAILMGSVSALPQHLAEARADNAAEIQAKVEELQEKLKG